METEPAPCPFCDPVRHVATWGWITTNLVYWAVPIDPVCEGHRLVVPIAHHRDAGARPNITGLVAGSAARYAEGLVADLGAEGYNLITSVGEAATQSVPHLHYHVVPRSAGDGLPSGWPWSY